MADEADKPWTIKAIPTEDRNAAIAAAGREGQTIGEWISRAIRAKIQADRQADRAPVPLGGATVGPSAPEVDLSSLERMVALAGQVHAMTGRPPGRGVVGPINRLLRVGLKGLDGRTREAPRSDRE
jgi:hypothetical protein